MLEIPLSIKYRPKRLIDVIGQDVVVQSLTNAFKEGTLHHAYVFAGFLGSGKTSCARILAAMENNDDGPSLEPNPESRNCKEIFDGKSMDVRELDAASNRGVDDIRQISKDIRYAPMSCRVRYVIIDEAQSLTGIAAEAALKMIEEPPPGVRFILATTEPHLIKDTIHSRCISFKFHKISWNLLYEHLQKIAKLEGFEYEPDALKIAARSASGSVRNALQNLQSLVNFCGKQKITLQAAEQSLGWINEKIFFTLLEAIVNIDVFKGYQAIENLLKTGNRCDYIIDGIYSHLRSLLLTRTCPKHLPEFGFSDEDIKRYSLQANLVGVDAVLQMMNFLVDVKRAMIFNIDPQVMLEKFLVDSVIWKKRAEAKKNIK